MSIERLEHWASTLRAEWPFKLRLRLWPITMIVLFFCLFIDRLSSSDHHPYDAGAVC